MINAKRNIIMARNVSRMVTRLAAAVAFAAITMSGPLMAENLPEPVSIPLDFVGSIKQTPDWLASELNAKGLPNGWKIENGNLVSSDLDVIKYVNRIQAFLALDPRIDHPYFILSLVVQKGATGTCVTLYPRDILPKLGALDFGQDQFTVPDLAADDIKKCLVKGPSGQPYESMDHAKFLATYFKKFGVLDIAHYQALDGDPDFIKKAYDLGFYPYQGSLAGYLHVD